MGIYPVRAATHCLLWMCAVVLLGLTGYRIHYTKALDNGDILTSSSNFYDPIIVELLVTSCLVIIGSLWFLFTLAARSRAGGLGSFAAEHFYLFIVWVMFLVGAAITTHKWRHLKFCRGSHKVCAVLETIKAFSWICWILLCFLIIMSLIDLFLTHSGFGDAAAGKSGAYGATAPATPAYPETRAAPTAAAYPAAPANAPPTRTTETTYTEVRAAEPQTAPVSHNV